MKVRILLFLVFITNLGWGQDTKKVWTLKELIDYAIANNLSVKRGTYGVKSSEITLLQSKMAMAPSLNASGNYGISWGRTIDPTTNNFTENKIENSNLGANANLLLWNGFRLFYGLKQSQVDLEAANEDLLRARNDVILSVINLYLNVVFNKELLAVAQYQLRSTQEQLDRIRKLSDAGAVPIGDVLNLEAQLATNEVNLVQRENSLTLSLLQLKQALQLPGTTPLDVEIPQIDITEAAVLAKSSEEIFETALMAMPEIRGAELRQKSSGYAWRSARGNFYPRISLTGSYSTVYSDQRQQFFPDGKTRNQPIGFVEGTNTPVLTTTPTGQLSVPSIGDQYNDNRGRSLGLSIQIPIFNGLATRSTMNRAAVNRQLADITLLETKNTLRQTVETAYNNAIAASKTYQSTEKQVKARDEAFRMAKQRYNLGGVNFVDYQVAENNLFQAQSDLLRAKYDLIFRKKLLDFYQGLPLEF